LGLKIKNIFQIKLNRNLFYLVGNEFVIAPLNKKKDNFFKLYLLNINEMKFISLLNLNSYSNDNNLNFILKNDNFLIIYEKDKILVFTYQETLNKILKYTFYIKREIFSIDILGNTIIFGDEDGCVSILTLSNKNSNNCLYISFIRKVKLGNTPILIKCFINNIYKETASENWRKRRITSSLHGPYGLGYTCATMVYTNRSYYVNKSKTLK